jgi:hypothetical protein
VVWKRKVGVIGLYVLIAIVFVLKLVWIADVQKAERRFPVSPEPLAIGKLR